MKLTKEFPIVGKVTVCVYCYTPKGNKTSCCKEVHFEPAYDIGDEYILVSETTNKENTNE